MKLTRLEIEHLAKLCRLKLTEAEIEKFSNQISDILEYVAVLNEVNTDGVLPTAQVTGLSNMDESDEVLQCENPDALLRCSPLPLQNQQIKVKPVF